MYVQKECQLEFLGDQELSGELQRGRGRERVAVGGNNAPRGGV